MGDPINDGDGVGSSHTEFYRQLGDGALHDYGYGTGDGTGHGGNTGAGDGFGENREGPPVITGYGAEY